MKFGDTLYQRSIPQWAPYNIDYNSLKKLIKERTTDIQTSPVSIPGQGSSSEVWRQLDDELFPILCDQHDQASRFIRSKHGEIERRLSYIERQAQIATQRDRTPNTRPIQQTKKYRRLVEEADSISNDIQALARFANAQKLAFRKILKKYRKWTHSSTLNMRMNNEVFNQHDAYLQPDLSPCLARLVAVSVIIRDLAHEKGSRGRTPNRLTSTSKVLKKGDDDFLDAVDFDAKFSAIRKDNQATYWIHKDNFSEARVLLMRHMREWRGQHGALTTDGSNLAVYDNPKRFLKDLDWPRPALSARWDDGAEQAIVAEEAGASETDEHHSTAIAITRVARRDLSAVLQEVASRADLHAIANVESTRSRFQTATNLLVLATLETAILMNATPGNENKATYNDQAFPHVVLDVRWSLNSFIPQAVLAFDQTHLAQRVPGFSIGFHAIHVVCKPSTKLPWQDMLETDIRKLPLDKQKKRVNYPRGSIVTSSELSSGSDSVFSSVGAQYSSQTSVTSSAAPTAPVSLQTSKEELLPDKGKRKIQLDPSFQKEASAPLQRYWNEFDDGEEFQDDSYAIYVDPDEPFSFPGMETFSKTFSAMYASLGKSRMRIISWLLLSSRKDEPDLEGGANERRPLLEAGLGIDADVDSSSGGSVTDKPRTKSRRRYRPSSARVSLARRYGTEPVADYPWGEGDSSRNTILTYAAAGLHVLAFLLLMLATILKATGRKKAAVEVEVGVICGWVAGLACGLGAMGCMASRTETIPGMEVAVVVVAGICELVWGVCLGVWVGGGD